MGLRCPGVFRSIDLVPCINVSAGRTVRSSDEYTTSILLSSSVEKLSIASCDSVNECLNALCFRKIDSLTVATPRFFPQLVMTPPIISLCLASAASAILAPALSPTKMMDCCSRDRIASRIRLSFSSKVSDGSSQFIATSSVVRWFLCHNRTPIFLTKSYLSPSPGIYMT